MENKKDAVESSAFKLVSEEYIQEIENDFKRKVSIAIKNRLKQKGMSIRDLAEAIDTSHPVVVRVTKQHNYNIDTLLKMLKVLDLDLEIINSTDI